MKYLSIILILVACLLGCDGKPEPKPLTLPNGDVIPPGASVTYEFDEDVGSEMYKHEGTAEGTGAGLSGAGDEVAAQFNASAPLSTLWNGSGASGGTIAIKQSLIGGSQTSPLLWAGLLAIVAAGVAFYFGLRRGALICGVLGGILIVASMLPQWAFVMIGLAGVGALIVYVYAEHKAKSRDELAASFAWARKDLPEPLRAEFDKFLDKHLNKNGAIDDTKTLASLQAKQGIV